MNSNEKKFVFFISLFLLNYLVGYICYPRNPSSAKNINFKYPPRKKTILSSNEVELFDSTQNPDLLNKTKQENIKPEEISSKPPPVQLQTANLATVKESVEVDLPQVPKTILYWYRPWGERRNRQLGEECGKCLITDDRSKIDSPSTGAVIFHFNELSKKTLPQKRNEEQYYVYNSFESPAYVLHVSGRDLHEYDDVFNWTMNYRRDADVYSPYFTMSTIMKEIKNNFNNTDDAGISWIIKQKQQLAVWVVTNCGYTNGSKDRMKLVDEMVQAGIDIDRRGRCFPDNPPLPWSRAEHSGKAHKDFMTSVKFYIAFENSHHCKDYITEKLFQNSYLAGSVPIVWGATKEDYEDVVPPHSCIFMDDFAGNLTKLADYIKYLDKNDTAYEEYFKWRRMDVEEMFGFGREYGPCLLCQMISPNNTQMTNRTFPTARRKVIKSLKSWSYDNEGEECMK